MVLFSAIVRATYVSKGSLHFRVNISKLGKGFLHFISNFEALVVLAKVEALFSLTNYAQKGGIFLFLKACCCCAKELDCLLKVRELTTNQYCDNSVF